jgi:hypothetical protein
MDVTSCTALHTSNMRIHRCVHSGVVHVCVIIDVCIDVIKMIVCLQSAITQDISVLMNIRQWITVL